MDLHKEEEPRIESANVNEAWVQPTPEIYLTFEEHLRSSMKNVQCNSFTYTEGYHTPLINQHKNFEPQTAYGENPMRKFKCNHSGNFENVNSMNSSKANVLVIVATLIATVTFVSASSFPAIHNQLQERSITRLLIICNSVAFVTSLAVVIHLLHAFPLKPWPQISVVLLFGAYMLLLFKISPDDAIPLLLFSILILLLAAAPKLCGLASRRASYVKSSNNEVLSCAI